jgi:hypothetical protein
MEVGLSLVKILFIGVSNLNRLTVRHIVLLTIKELLNNRLKRSLTRKHSTTVAPLIICLVLGLYQTLLSLYLIKGLMVMKVLV